MLSLPTHFSRNKIASLLKIVFDKKEFYDKVIVTNLRLIFASIFQVPSLARLESITR